MSDRQSDNEERIALLASKWQHGTITDEERDEFDQWFDSFDDTAEMHEHDELKEKMYQSIVKRERIGRTAGLLWIKPVAAAAALLGVVITAALWFNNNHQQVSRELAHSTVKSANTKIVPGGNKAMLVLSNGDAIILDSARNGLLAKQDAADVVKEADGSLIYKKTGAGDVSNAGSLYNTLTTPRGGQYTIVLPDGSKVWLNAASTIRFPAHFSGERRRVEVQGEAYFEIAQNASTPFVVAVNYPDAKVMDVEVLGTSFNIMAYPEEKAVKTTLLTGAVKVSSNSESKVLHPGQQVQLQEGVLQTSMADTEAVIAWKNGQTLFVDEDITAIMRKISRWYDVDIEYKGTIPNKKFTGGISRQSDISAILKILELNHIHSSIQGKKVILMQ